MFARSLQSGDTIGIIAPSKPFSEEKRFELDNFIEYMKTQDINVVLSEHFYSQEDKSIGSVSAENRASDINSMFTDKDIDAIWCFQGGDPANQTLDLIDYDLVTENPKLFLGKSDIDVLLLALNKMTGLVTFHTCDTKIGSNKEMDFEYTKNWFKKRLFEKSKTIEPSEEWICVNKGEAEGRLLGCNPVSILKLAGTKYFPDFTDSILFIETYKSDPKETRVHLTQLKQAGVFDKIKGVVIGNNFEFSSEEVRAEEVIGDFLTEYNFPILKTNEFGHYQPHAFLPVGTKVRLDATNKTIDIVEDFLQ
ncbi:LD-carboxypeptidase [Candidatus Pacebacteria bacterium]|nr:LD-carboxypeptidase [Candidatus Paceibacterota bacterium]